MGATNTASPAKGVPEQPLELHAVSTPLNTRKQTQTPQFARVLLARPVHLRLAVRLRPRANGRVLERVAESSKQPQRADRSRSTRGRLHPDAATLIRPPAGDLASAIAQQRSHGLRSCRASRASRAAAGGSRRSPIPGLQLQALGWSSCLGATRAPQLRYWRKGRRARRVGRDWLSFRHGHHERRAMACSEPGWMAIDAARFASKQKPAAGCRCPIIPDSRVERRSLSPLRRSTASATAGNWLAACELSDSQARLPPNTGMALASP